MRGASSSTAQCRSTDFSLVMASSSYRVLKKALPVALAALGVWAIRSRAKNQQAFTESNRMRRPVDKDGVVIGAGAVDLEGDPDRAALLVHGFGDTPQSMRYLADALNRAGWTVHVLRLPGHGAPLAEYATATAEDWLDAVRAKYQDMRDRHETVVVCGISMGGALATILAADNPEIPALVLLAPYYVMPRNVFMQMVVGSLVAFPIPYHTNTGSDLSIHDPDARAQTLGIGIVSTRLLGQLRRVAAWARAAVPEVRTPVLYLQSREDNRLLEVDAVEQFARLGSHEKQQRWLSGCGHIITVDYCRDEVARQVIEWFAPAFHAQKSKQLSERPS